MIKLSKRGEYGIEILVALAKTREQGHISLKQISESNNLPLPFLSRIMSDLKNIGLLSSKEGIGGGYQLAKNPSEINLLDIIDALEGAASLVECMLKDGTPCKRAELCTVKSNWNKLNQEFMRFFKNTTLQEFIDIA